MILTVPLSVAGRSLRSCWWLSRGNTTCYWHYLTYYFKFLLMGWVITQVVLWHNVSSTEAYGFPMQSETITFSCIQLGKNLSFLLLSVNFTGWHPEFHISTKFLICNTCKNLVPYVHVTWSSNSKMLASNSCCWWWSSCMPSCLTLTNLYMEYEKELLRILDNNIN